MTITPRSVQKWVQERVQNDPYNLHAKNPCGFHATLFVQRLSHCAAEFLPLGVDPAPPWRGFFMGDRVAGLICTFQLKLGSSSE